MCVRADAVTRPVRHNTLDKLGGKALQSGIDTAGCIIVTTDRISSEMLGKAAKMEVPVVASRTSPTSRSVALARACHHPYRLYEA